MTCDPLDTPPTIDARLGVGMVGGDETHLHGFVFVCWWLWEEESGAGCEGTT